MMNKSFHQQAVGILGIIAVFLTFLLPIKFGMIVGTPEVAFPMPDTLLTLLFFNWPPALFSLSSALLLLGLTVCAPPPNNKEFKSHTTLIAFTWVLLFLGALPGAVNASVRDFVYIQLLHFAGIAAFAMAIMRLVQLRPEIKPWLLNALVASTLLTALMGLSQYFSGFKETLNYVYKQEMETGVKISSGMHIRLQETRIFATFSICNSLAAHLVLTIPLCIWAIFKNKSTLKAVVVVFAAYGFIILAYAGIHPIVFFLLFFILLSTTALILTRTTDKNFKYIMPLILLPSTGLLLFILRYTNSRGGLIAFTVSIVLLVFLTPLKRKIKIALALLAVLLITPAIFSDIFARSLASMEVRFDYFISALKMFKNHPICGTGWGDFFHDYTQIKAFPGSEAPHTPHNFVLAFTSQSGILGLIASLLTILLPFWFYFRSHPIKNFNWKNAVILTGWTAWAIHSMVDFNIQVCGTVASGIVMLMLLDFIPQSDKKAEKEMTNKNRLIWNSLLILLSAATLIFAFISLKNETEYAALQELCRPRMNKADSGPVSFDKIEQQLKRTAKQMPYSPFPWICAGNYAQERREWPRSEMYFREALKRSSERASIYYRLSISQQQLGKNKQAKENLKQAAKLFPNSYQEKYDSLK